MEEEKKELEEQEEVKEEKEEVKEEPKEEEKQEEKKEEPKIVKAFTDTKDETGEFDKKDIEENSVISLFAYIWILWLVPLLGAKDSKYARYHTNQGLVLFIFVTVISAVLVGLSYIPYVGIVFAILGYIFWALTVVFMVLGIVNAVQGKAKELPLIGKIKLLDYKKEEPKEEKKAEDEEK